MSSFQFGNDPAKIDRYRAFWNLSPVDRPMIGFTAVGWFPLDEFAPAKSWSGDYVTADMIDPQAFIPDHIRMIAEGDTIHDDLIRGAGPTNVAVPFLPGMLGCPLRLLPDNVMGVERNLSWEDALAISLDSKDVWLQKYLEFADTLVEASGGKFPVSHGAEIGPTDIHAVLRGHMQAIIDLVESPEQTSLLLMRAGEMFAELTEVLWKHVPLFEEGWFDGQYSLWAPEPIARLQEDASAVFSPEIYRELVQPVDRMLAKRFPSAFMHLHSTSMFLLDTILEIEELRCFEINNDVVGPPLDEMLPYFQKVQSSERSLLIRGSFNPQELGYLVKNLDHRGLFLLVMVEDLEEIEPLKKTVGM